MGRHVNPDVPVDQRVGDQPVGDQPAVEKPAVDRADARDAAPDRWLEPQAVISDDTHVGSAFDEIAPGTPDAAPSPANPNALIQHGLVGDGKELE